MLTTPFHRATTWTFGVVAMVPEGPCLGSQVGDGMASEWPIIPRPMRTVIQASGLHKHYGPKAILEDAEVSIREDHRLAVIGRNGAGKSTFCKMILGEEEADAGTIKLHADLRLAYLEQKDPFGETESVLQFLVRKSGAPEWRCGEIAGKFLLSQELLGRRALDLSGGFQTRVRLCSMLLTDPTFLILDEPTNYLDLKTLLLLEQFLRSFDGGYLVVSHDREFLMRTCTETLEVARGRMTLHPGKVSDYLAYKAARREQINKLNTETREKRAELEDWIARNKATASKATQAESRRKQLEKLEDIELDHEEDVLSMRLPNAETRTGTALLAQGLTIGYPERVIAKDITFDLDRGSHVAVVGDNGQGKSTFLKAIAGTIAPLAGTLKWGYDMRIGTYAQHVFQQLPDTSTVRSWLEKQAAAAPGATIKTQEILDLAGTFLFRGDEVDKHIRVLSGGERSRLLLCGLLLGRYPALLLDEPTNHLDFETVEALADALKAYNGTLFLVSHDRTFVERIATQVIEVKDGKATLFPDGYAAYCWRLEQDVGNDSAAPGAAPRPAERPMAASSTPAIKTSAQDVREASKRIKGVERDLKRLDERKKQLEVLLAADPTVYKPAETSEFEEVKAKIAALEEEWLGLSEIANA